jgi:hypothetical protein
MLGRCVHEDWHAVRADGTLRARISLSGAAAGMYLLSCSDKRGTAVRSLIVR